MASNQHPAQHINNLDQELQHPRPRLLNRQQHGLNVVLEEDARDVVVCNLLGLLRHGVLVRHDGVGGRGGAPDGVDGGDDGEEVLELVEVGRGGVDCAVEGIDEGGVEGAEGELRDDVGEVELW